MKRDTVLDAAARGYRTLLVSLARYLATDAMSESWEETPFGSDATA